MNNPKRYTVTAALPYANGPVHIGHLAGCYLPADIYVRYLRLRGKDVRFVCGSDEHGVPITIKAKKEGVTPQDIVDRYHGMMKNAFADFGIDFDIYSRTSSKVHHENASEFFKTLYEKGALVERETQQYYDAEAKQFLADRYITGTCPNCSHDGAYGDQCENCGTSLSPTDLINPKSALSGAIPELKGTKNWFLPLDKLSPKLRAYLDEHKDWKSNVYGQCKSWLDSGDGLQPRAMTRDLDWGVPVPVEGGEGKVLYVWFDAPIGYISATRELEGENWEQWWKDEETKLVHFIGKDNIVFHCIIFPAMLMEHGGYVLADNVPANEFLNLEGDKISTSRNWAVWLHEYLEDFPGKQDVLRYALGSTMPETKDNDFTWKDFQARNNNELVAILGNFVNRVMVLNKKYYDGVLPEGVTLSDEDKSTLAGIKIYADRVSKGIENYKFRDALAEFMNLARLGNKYLAEQEPWKLVKTDAERTKTVMFTASQIAASLAVLAQPFLPHTAEKLKSFLAIDELEWSLLDQELILKEGHSLGEFGILFDKIEDKEVDAQIEKLEATKNADPDYESVKEEIQFDDFQKIDLRVGTIIEAVKVPKAKKLLNLTIDLGFETRTILSGIAEHYTAEEIVGKKVTVVANLAPRKMRGIESQGMILMGETKEGKLTFADPGQEAENGYPVA
ncbi:MAG: methionine--tRNA ligase [Schleiferiaceae bacterium]|jgi:methionyl-tRNA synthetase|nr:methionine--tRNA ligase [Schleiferiaceae bacterium]